MVPTPPRRFTTGLSLTALALGLVGVLLGVLHLFPMQSRHDLAAASIGPWGGRAYVAAVPKPRFAWLQRFVRIDTDTPSTPSASGLRLLEQGKPIGAPHTIHAEIEQQAGGRFSHWGDHVIFSASDGSDPRANGRAYAVSYPIVPKPGIVLALLAIGLAGLAWRLATATVDHDRLQEVRSRGLAGMRVVRFLRTYRGYLFLAYALLLTAWINFAFVELLAAPVAAPDSLTYLVWSMVRTIGYSLFIEGYHALFGTWAHLHLLQLNLLLAGLFCLAYAVARVTDSFLLGWLLLALVVAWADMILSAADFLTEAPFSAFVMLHAGLFVLFLRASSRALGVTSGAALGAAILVKSVAVVLVGPLLLFLVFLRRRQMLYVIVPALLAWIAPSAYNYARNGFFESSIVAGYAMGGHVAWGIRASPDSAYPVEAALIEEKVRPILARRPQSFASRDAYAHHTLYEYNPMLWDVIAPALHRHYEPGCTNRPPPMWFESCTWLEPCRSSCMVVVNRTLLALSREAIRDNPQRFAYHVYAHDVSLWRDLFAHGGGNLVLGTDARAGSLDAAYDQYDFRARLAPLPPFRSAGERAAAVASLSASPAWRLADLTIPDGALHSVRKIFERNPLPTAALSLAACLVVLWLPKVSVAAQACCYSALCLNAYFLGTALAQPSLTRYAWTMQGIAAAFLCLGVFVAWRRLAGLARRFARGARRRSAA